MTQVLTVLPAHPPALALVELFNAGGVLIVVGFAVAAAIRLRRQHLDLERLKQVVAYGLDATRWQLVDEPDLAMSQYRKAADEFNRRFVERRP